MSQKITKKSGKFLISLDFELHWGVRDKRTIEQYKDNLLGVRQVIPSLLNIFSRYNTHATFLTVGFLFFDKREDLLKNLPATLPPYKNKKLSPYLDLVQCLGATEKEDPYHYALSLIKQIQNTPHQEIGCHTFSHYYCLENGQTEESFRADLETAIKAAKKIELSLKSLGFPRNQHNPDHTVICQELGFTSFRGNERSWLYKPRSDEDKNIVQVMLRLLDSYLNISGHHCYKIEDIAKNKLLFDIPSSRFLRPHVKKLKFLDWLKLKRITDSMTHAAKNNLVYHLWWHPHNFGTNLEKNMLFLEGILTHYKKLNENFDFQSVTMSELSQLIKENYGE